MVDPTKLGIGRVKGFVGGYPDTGGVFPEGRYRVVEVVLAVKEGDVGSPGVAIVPFYGFDCPGRRLGEDALFPFPLFHVDRGEDRDPEPGTEEVVGAVMECHNGIVNRDGSAAALLH